MSAQPPSARTGKTRNGIAYDVQGDGRAVVLITGSNLDRRMRTREAAWLAKDHTVVRYDLRAHGASDTAFAPFLISAICTGCSTSCGSRKPR